MLIKFWFDFAYSLAAFACGLFLLFEGTRRIRAGGFDRKVALLAGAGAIACLMYICVALWLHATFKELAHPKSTYIVPKELPDGWGSNMPPEKREEYGLMLARALFDQSGTFGEYFDRDGVRKPSVPTERDIAERDVLLLARDRFDLLARVSKRDAIVLMCVMFAAVVGGVWRTKGVAGAGR
jgi:hypothetical protein